MSRPPLNRAFCGIGGGSGRNAVSPEARGRAFSLLYMNPPYDFQVGEGKNQRMEKLFLEHCFR